MFKRAKQSPYSHRDFDAAVASYRDAHHYFMSDLNAGFTGQRVFEHHIMAMDIAYQQAVDMANRLNSFGIAVGHVPVLHRVDLIHF